LGRNVQQERLAVLQPATSGQPVERNLLLRIALAIAGGLALSLAIVFGWYLLDDRFVSVQDIKDQFGDVVLGLVPQVRVPRSQPRKALVEPRDSRHAYAESYRYLRSAVLLSGWRTNRPQTFLVSATTSGEGRATVAANLAQVLAKSGLRVVLVDADLHGGRMHRLFDGEPKPGLSDYLQGEISAAAILRSTGIPGLLFIARGEGQAHPDGLFLGSRFAELMTELRSGQDFVILVSAPILAADDAALLVPHADGVILVARPFSTRARLLRQSLEMLHQRQAKQVAVVLNRARADDLAGFHAQNWKGSSRNGTA
jgi:succinoglycan biosynthesis transport protein ExoP